MTAPWEAPGLTAEERAAELVEHGRELHEADSTPFVGCAGFPYMEDAITAAIRAACEQARRAEREACAKGIQLKREASHRAQGECLTQHARDVFGERVAAFDEALAVIRTRAGGEGV